MIGTWLASVAFVALLMAGALWVDVWAERRDRRRDCGCSMCAECEEWER